MDYRKKVNEDEEEEIMAEVFKEKQRINSQKKTSITAAKRRKLKRS